MATVVLLGTCDTKLDELLFLRSQIRRHQPSPSVVFIDAGRSPVSHPAITISQPDLIARYGTPSPATSPSDLPRGDLIKHMSACATRAVRELHSSGAVSGIIAAGGSGNTSLAAAVMRDALPIGVPKLIVSTVASGDTGPLVRETDIALLYSVVDVAGLNRVLRGILANAGAAIAGAATAYHARRLKEEEEEEGGEEAGGEGKKTRVGITMFGVTTPGVDAARAHLESRGGDVETLVFHATGHGGLAMERLVREGELDAVLDLTTTEICDLVAGGNMSAGPHRLEAAAEAGIPYVLSLGATDMVNFGPRATVPERYRDRKLYEHNPVVTLMRTSKDECRLVGEFICSQLKEHVKRPELVEVWIPSGGASVMSTPGGPFADEEADGMLFSTVRNGLQGSGIRVVEDARDVNDAAFARDIAEALVAKIGIK